MKKLVNESHLEGYIYDHELVKKVTGESSKHPGTEFISGILQIATDEDCLNVIPVHFTYVTEVTAKGKPNATYGVLANIIEGTIGTVMKSGKDSAGKIRIDSAIGLNEFYSNRSGDDSLVSIARNEGGFIHTVQTLPDEKARATFNTDMVITHVSRMEADPERDLPERGKVKGCVFDFRGAILPVTFTVINPKAIDYFEGLEASNRNPVFTRVQGQQISKTIIKRTEEESAFGEAIVKETRSSQKDFVINWAQPDPYEWDSEDTILASEFSEAIANREIYLADMKRRQDEYKQNKGSAFAAAPASVPSKGEYKF